MVLGYKEFKEFLESKLNYEKTIKDKMLEWICYLCIMFFIVLSAWCIYDMATNIDFRTYINTGASFVFAFLGVYINRKYDTTKRVVNQMSLIDFTQESDFIYICSKINKDQVCVAIEELKHDRKTTLNYIWIGIVAILIPMVSFLAKKIFEEVSFLTTGNIFFFVWLTGLLIILIIIIPLFFNESLSKDSVYLQLYKKLLSQQL